MAGRTQAAATFFVALMVAVVFQGSTAPISAFHPECIDGIDNDGDGGIDHGAPNPTPPPAFADPDPECIAFPWINGNGESATDPSLYTTEERGYVRSVFSQLFEFDDGYPAPFDPCGPYGAFFPVEDGSRDQQVAFCSPP